MPNFLYVLVAAMGRDCASTTFPRSVCWVRARSFSEGHVSPGSLSGREMMREKLWREFFSDPSQWWDHRSEKINPRYPDFRHKKTQQALWIIDDLTPPWVDAELTMIAPDLLQVHIFSWNVRLRRHLKAGDFKRTLNLYQQMQREGMILDKFTFVAVLNACSSLRSLEEGRRVHEQIIRRRCESHIYVANCLIDMYAKCGSIEDAWSVFNRMLDRNVVSWSAMIGGYVKSEQGLKAIELFRKMQQEGVEPNAVTFIGILNACACLAALKEGRLVHEQIIQRGCESDAHVANCLVDMYAKCGSLDDAWIVFIKMHHRNVVSWSAMIWGYVKSEQGLKAIELYRKMKQEGVEPNTVTFIGVLHACSSIAALEEGRHVHEQIIQRGCESDVHVATCLVDMYAKCGGVNDALSVFNKMRERDVVSWSAMIGGYAMHGHPKKAIGLLKRMGKEHIEINDVTLTCLLSACSHGGLVKEGRRYFKDMTSCYNVLPTKEHFACIIDLLGRAGQLEEAEEIMIRMPMEGNAALWMSLLGACRSHGNIKMAERAAKRCWLLDPDNASCYILLSNIYASS